MFRLSPVVSVAGVAPLAKTALEKIAALYRIEAEIRGRPPDERLRARTDRSAPLFADLKAWLEVTLRRSR